MRHSQKHLFALPSEDLEEVLHGLEKEWNQIRNARLFVSGGTGFFGKWLLGALAFADSELDLKLHVDVLSRKPARFLEKYPEAAQQRALHFLTGNVESFHYFPHRCDFVLHAATDTLSINTPALEEGRSEAIIRGTAHMLDLARQSGARRFLNVSSGAVYGAAAAQPSGAREEDDVAAQPATVYGRAKRDAGLLCAESGLDFSTARAFAFLGPHLPLDAHYAAGNFLRDAQAGGPIRVRGDGTALRSYLYPTDLVVWLLRILLLGQTARAYNVGSDETVSTAELARQIAAASPGAPEVIIESVQSPGPQNIYLPNIQRARVELALTVKVSLNQAIRRTLLWLDKL